MTHINPQIKQFFVKLAIKTLNALSHIGKPLGRFFQFILINPLWLIIRFIYQWLILPIYKIFVTIIIAITRSIGPINNKYLVPFINRYVVHMVVVAMTVTVVFLNYQVKNTRAQSFGEKSILYALAKSGDLSDAESFSEGFDTYVQDTPTDLDNYPNNEPLITQTGGLYGTDITSPEAFTSARSTITKYTVVSGDNVGSIAKKFNLKTDTLIWANNLSPKGFLQLNQVLLIPPVDGVIYTVKRGDTLGGIVKKLDGDLTKAVAFNKLAGTYDISIGQTLIVPDGKPLISAPSIQKPKIAKITDIINKPNIGSPNVGITGLIWPTVTRRLSQYFGWKHTGLDIDGDFGDPIWASADGVVSKVKYLNYGYGFHVTIDHPDGKQTLYAHFQKIFVTPGESVTKGQSLGEMGSTGRSTGSHLHYEVRVGGKRLNPLNYVSRK